jgi:hypothetical protein
VAIEELWIVPSPPNVSSQLPPRDIVLTVADGPSGRSRHSPLKSEACGNHEAKDDRCEWPIIPSPSLRTFQGIHSFKNTVELDGMGLDKTS